MAFSIESGIIPFNKIVSAIAQIMQREIQLQENDIKERLERYLNPLKDNLNVFFEFPYVDKVYRDTYYHYYSTKHYSYLRNCIRLSLFDCELDKEHFRSQQLIEKLNENYLGFIVIRPLPLHLWGRSILSPKAFKNNDFVCCLANINTSTNGVKFNVAGFPHSSQDSEMITCAETTLWSIMEYFGNRYPEYKPVLPSRINRTLSNISFERQMPSHGLTSLQMSFALKDFDFGVRIYSSKEYGNNFNRIISYYIESGIPIIGLISNTQNQGHAIILIGRECNIENRIDSLHRSDERSINGTKIKITDSADISKNIVIIDDNHPPYQLAPLDRITSYYAQPSFLNMSLYSVIVPLYSKVYLEAAKARFLLFALFKEDKFNWNWGINEIVLRFFLTSSRSFKDEIVKDISLNAQVKELIIEKTMPKFIWVAEISDKTLFKQKKCNGLIVLDATEFNPRNSLIFGIQPDKFILVTKGKVYKLDINLGIFNSLKTI